MPSGTYAASSSRSDGEPYCDSKAKPCTAIADERLVDVAELEARSQEIGKEDDVLAAAGPFSKRDGSIPADERRRGADPALGEQQVLHAMIAADEIRSTRDDAFTIAEFVIAGMDETAARMPIEKSQLPLDLGRRPDVV
jgi:hypothetical protein